MKCRVCGSELDPQKSYCDKCGTAVSTVSVGRDSGEFSWNTIDFPKPKDVHDIEMNWGSNATRQSVSPAMQQTPVFNWNMSAQQAQPVQQAPQYQAQNVQPQVQQPVQQQTVQPQVQQAVAQPQVQPQYQAPVYQQPQLQPAVQPQMNYTMPQQMSWTMPQSVWSMPTQQQVVIPQPYNVQPMQMPQAPTLSAMPQMPAMAQQPMQYTMPPQPVAQQPQVQPAVQPQMQYTMPMQYTMQPQVQTPMAQTQSFTNAAQPDPRVQTMPSAPAAIKNPIDVSEWLDKELQGTSMNFTPAPVPSFNVDPVPSAAPAAASDFTSDTAPASSGDNKFFTFYKKNEDFQKLLDEEYQRYKTKYDTNAESLRRSTILSAAAVNKAAQQGAYAQPQTASQASAPAQAGSETKAPLSRDTRPNLPDFDTASKAPEQTMIFDAAAFEAAAKKKAAETEELSNGDVFNTINDEPLMEEPITDFDKMLMEGTKDSENLGESTLAISNDDLRKEINDLAQTLEEATSTPVHAYEKGKRQQNLQNMADARKAFFAELNTNDEENQDKQHAQEMKSIFEEWNKERKEEEEEKERKGGFGRFLLTIILLVALFVIADVLCLKFVNNDTITGFFNTVNTQAVELFNDITGKDISIDTASVAETAQARAAAAVNKNIEQITFDVESSKYDSTKLYAFDNLGSAAVVTDEDLICSITELITAYDSSWVDYVNEGSDISCYEYLMTDSAAFSAASKFDKLGKTEVFKKLNIGEIRQDGDNIYAFVNEQIEVSKGESTTSSNSDMVYLIQPSGEEYKIVEWNNYSE